jgi:cyclophilin family peptidyl-prolyl cis-trans isomerase
MGGDPFTFFYNDPHNKKHILRWGNGGVGYEQPPEQGRYVISHRPGVVTSSMSPDGDWASGSQFMIMTGVDADLDKRHTPFAKVVEGLGIVERIAKRKSAGDHGPYQDEPSFQSVDTRDLIVDPAILHKVIVYENGVALPHDFPLTDSEKSIASLSQMPVQPLTGDALYAGRKMRAVDGEGEIRPGLDIPFPDDVDLKDAKQANPLGDRITAKARDAAEDKPATADDKKTDPADEKRDK